MSVDEAAASLPLDSASRGRVAETRRTRRPRARRVRRGRPSVGRSGRSAHDANARARRRGGSRNFRGLAALRVDRILAEERVGRVTVLRRAAALERIDVACVLGGGDGAGRDAEEQHEDAGEDEARHVHGVAPGPLLLSLRPASARRCVRAGLADAAVGLGVPEASRVRGV